LLQSIAIIAMLLSGLYQHISACCGDVVKDNGAIVTRHESKQKCKAVLNKVVFVCQ